MKREALEEYTKEFPVRDYVPEQELEARPFLSVAQALSFVSAAENGRRLEMDLKLRGAGDSTRSSGSGVLHVIHEISD